MFFNTFRKTSPKKNPPRYPPRKRPFSPYRHNSDSHLVVVEAWFSPVELILYTLRQNFYTKIANVFTVLGRMSTRGKHFSVFPACAFVRKCWENNWVFGLKGGQVFYLKSGNGGLKDCGLSFSMLSRYLSIEVDIIRSIDSSQALASLTINYQTTEGPSGLNWIIENPWSKGSKA